MECVQCCLPGDLCDYPFHKHFLDERHFLGVRVKEPYELYCDVCGDFQYSAEFDKVCLYVIRTRRVWVEGGARLGGRPYVVYKTHLCTVVLWILWASVKRGK